MKKVPKAKDYFYYDLLRVCAEHIHTIHSETDVSYDELFKIVHALINVRYKNNPCKSKKV